MLVMLVVAAVVLAVAPAQAGETLPGCARYLVKQMENQLQVKIAWGRTRTADNGDFLIEEMTWAAEVKPGKIRPVAFTRLVRVSGMGQEGDLVRCRRIAILDTEIRADAEDIDNAEGKPLRIRIPEIVMEDNSILPPGKGRDEIERMYEGQVMSARMVISEIRFLSPLQLRIGEIVYTFDGNRRNLAGRGTLTVSRIELPEDIDRMMKRKDALGQLGIDRIVLSLGAAWTLEWDEKKRSHVDVLMRFGMAQAGELGIEIGDLVLPLELVRLMADAKESSRVEELFEARDPAIMNMLQNEVTLRGLKVFWKDEGLTERLIAIEARRKGIGREDVIEAWAAAPQAYLFIFGLPNVGMQASEAVKTFLQNPGKLEISMHAKAPMNFSTLLTLMEDPKGLVEALNLKITANGP